jgi:hypothetical protein
MKSRTERNFNKMKKELEENPVQKPLTAEQVLVKLVIDSQNNINRLAVMQEQQMVYINTLFKQVIRNESTNSPSAGTTAAVSTQTGTINHSSQPSDNQSVTEENKTL